MSKVRINELNGFLSADPAHELPATFSGSTGKLTVQQIVDLIVDGSPAALDTLNELSAALGDDANFAATVTTALSERLKRDGTNAMTGNLDLGGNAILEAVVADAVDATKRAQFDASGITTATTRNIILPDADLDFASDNGSAPKFVRQSGFLRDDTGYAATTTTAYAAAAGSFSVAPVKPDTKLRCVFVCNLSSVGNAAGDEGFRMRKEFYDGATWSVPSSSTDGVSSIIGSTGDTVSTMHDVVPLVFELASTERRSDTGDWNFRLNFSSMYVGSETSILEMLVLYEEIDE